MINSKQMNLGQSQLIKTGATGGILKISESDSSVPSYFTTWLLLRITGCLLVTDSN